MVDALNVPLVATLHAPVDEWLERASAYKRVMVSCLLWICIVLLLLLVFHSADLLEACSELLTPLFFDSTEVVAKLLQDFSHV